VTAIQLRIDGDRQFQASHRGAYDFCVRCGRHEVAAEPDEHLGTAIDHRCEGIDDSMPVMLRRRERENLLDLSQEFRARGLRDSYGSIALNIGVAAHRTDSGPGPAEVAPHQQQIGELLHVLGALAVLGDPHAIDDDARLRLDIDVRYPLDLCALEAGSAKDVVPGCGPDVLGERLEAGRVRVDERQGRAREDSPARSPRSAPLAPTS